MFLGAFSFLCQGYGGFGAEKIIFQGFSLLFVTRAKSQTRGTQGSDLKNRRVVTGAKSQMRGTQGSDLKNRRDSNHCRCSCDFYPTQFNRYL